MSKRDYRILIGTADWHHPGWGNEIFYPDDLPSDWYLSFYSNEFPVVLVPEHVWDSTTAMQILIDEIQDQATPGFKCVLECEWLLQNTIKNRLDALMPIKDTLAGLLIYANIKDFESETFQSDIESLLKSNNVCIELKNDDGELTKVRAFCEQHAISLCWTGYGEIVVPEQSSLWITRCHSEQDKKILMKDLKSLIAEQLTRETVSREHVLIIDGAPPKIETARTAMIMLDLM